MLVKLRLLVVSQNCQCAFVKVEATKFTEVGYVGRDVESMVRDLVENAIQIVEKQQYSRVCASIKKANQRLVKVLVPGIKRTKTGWR